jgi:8-oxo-dGTP pyrophosphatase MutT (NUDIX family)
VKFYVGQKAVIERDGKVLVLFSRGLVDLPGGKVQEGETDLVAALRREVREETSLEIEVGEPFATDLSSDAAVFFVAYRCRYASGEVVLSDEHDAFRWVDSSSYQKLPNANPLYRMLRSYFEALAMLAG